MTKSEKPNYIVHIDGLRAIAVLGVVLFHLDVSGFSGGFVGVDIFFVISGFLISSHLLTEIESGTFTFLSFYNRRIRRLLPALLLTLIATLLAGYFLFPAANFERLATSTLFSLFSLANVFFYSEAGYFGGEAILKPLLHMWSLSVEEQFYLLWPALLVFLASRKHVLISVLAIGLASFVFSDLYFNKDSSAVFFLTPFRIGEFVVGASLYWVCRFQSSYQWLDELLSIVGLICIGLSFAWFDEQMRFPGLSALLPCLGAALLIYAGSAKYAGWVLRNRTMVVIGLISYSFYLTHWPTIVFYKYSSSGALSPIEQLTLFAGSLLLAVPLYFLAEKPFRAKHQGQFRIVPAAFYSWLIVIAFGLVAVTVKVIWNEGFPGRFDARHFTSNEIEQGKVHRFDIYRALCAERTWEKCKQPSTNKIENVLVIGDSHAMDGLNIFAQAFPEYHYTIRSQTACPPIAKVDLKILLPKHPERKKCVALNRERFAEIDSDQYGVIVISVLFDWYQPEHLMNAIARIKEKSEAQIIVLGNYVQFNRDFTDLINNGIRIEERTGVVKHFSLFEEQLADLADEHYWFISKKALLCEDDMIESCTFWVGDVPVIYDHHHLSVEGAGFLAQMLKAKYSRLERVQR